MKFDHYLKRVEESGEFKKFKEEHKRAYLAAGFFVLDFEAGKHMHQVDFFIPSMKKMATFILEEGIKVQISDLAKGKKPKKLEEEPKLDLDALKGIVMDEMHNRTITQEISKIIAVVSNQEGKLIWSLNCLTNDLGLIKVHIDDNDSNILKFEKINLFDFMKKVDSPVKLLDASQFQQQGIKLKEENPEASNPELIKIDAKEKPQPEVKKSKIKKA